MMARTADIQNGG